MKNLLDGLFVKMSKENKKTSNGGFEQEAFLKRLYDALYDSYNIEPPQEITEDHFLGVLYALSVMSDDKQKIILEIFAYCESLEKFAKKNKLTIESAKELRDDALFAIMDSGRMLFVKFGISGCLKGMRLEEYTKGKTQGNQEGYDIGCQEGYKQAYKKAYKHAYRDALQDLQQEFQKILNRELAYAREKEKVKLCKKITELNISPRAMNALIKKFGEKATIEQIVSLTHEEILRINNIGIVSAIEIAKELVSFGFVDTAWKDFIIE